MRLPQIPWNLNESSSASSCQLRVNKTVCRSLSLKSLVWSMSRIKMGVFTDPFCQFGYRTRVDRDAKELSQKGNFIQWILPHLCILTAQTYPWYCWPPSLFALYFWVSPCTFFSLYFICSRIWKILWFILTKEVLYIHIKGGTHGFLSQSTLTSKTNQKPTRLCGTVKIVSPTVVSLKPNSCEGFSWSLFLSSAYKSKRTFFFFGGSFSVWHPEEVPTKWSLRLSFMFALHLLGKQ